MIDRNEINVAEQYEGGENPEKTQTNPNLPLFPGGLLDGHDQELNMTAETTMMINETCC